MTVPGRQRYRYDRIALAFPTPFGATSSYADAGHPAPWALLGRGASDRNERVMIGSQAYRDAQDADLISWSAGGDKRAFDEIVTRHGPFALRVATRLLSDASAAEDVAQEAMFRAWSQAGAFDSRRARFTTWLYRIVVNLAIDQRRRHKPEQLPDDFDSVDPSARADEMMEINERRSALTEALDCLPGQYRAAITLDYDEGMAGAEAASVLGVSTKALERLLARARGLLRERLRTTNQC